MARSAALVGAALAALLLIGWTLQSASADAEKPSVAAEPSPPSATTASEKERRTATTLASDAVVQLDEDGDESAPKKRRYVVAAMGDSLTDPKSHGGKYLEYLQKKCPKSRFDSYGKGGNMVNQMRRRFARDILGLPKKKDAKAKPKYTHVIVLGGINDICSDESANRTNDKIKADLTKMYTMAQDHDIEVLAITMPPWAGFTRFYNERRGRSTRVLNKWIREQVKTDKVDSVLDIYPIMSCGEPEFLCEAYGWPDKVHWNKKGHEVVGKALHAHDFADCE